MYKKRSEPKEYSGFFARNKLLIAITTLIGTIVGAGILGIPYVIAKAGFLYGLILLVLIGGAFIFLNLFTGEIVLRTKSQHQLPGYAGKYLGAWGKRLMTFSLVFIVYGALTAYLIGEGQVLKAIFGGGNPLLYTLAFFLITAYIIRRGVKATGKAELFLIAILVVVIILIGVFSFNNIDAHNLKGWDISMLFIPYGVILFSFMGSPAVPEMQEELGKDKKKLKKAIIIGSVIPIALYIIFTIVIVGIIGLEQFELLSPNERIATVALSVFSHRILGIFANILAVLAMFTSFLTLGTAMVESYSFDYGIPRGISFLLTLSPPLLIALFDLTTFIAALGVTGAVAGGLEGILIILSYWKAKRLGDRKPEYTLSNHFILGTILIAMFLFGILYNICANLF